LKVREPEMDHREFISLAEYLPLEMKIELIERLLESITPSEPAIEQLWEDEAERRAPATSRTCGRKNT